MTQIHNDTEFRKTLLGLSYSKQRELAALFVNNVIDLSGDDRLSRLIQVALDNKASDSELAAALKSAKSATFDSHTRCGSEGDWKEQAGYFVARAVAAALTPESQCRIGGPAWQAAMSCRMARTSVLIDADNTTTSDESEQQYKILDNALDAK